MQKAIVLAAGKGTRLQTEGITVPKVMREADGKPLLHYVLKNLDFIDRENIVLVVGYRREDVLAAFGDYPHAVQEPQLGTGHAAAVAKEAVGDSDGPVLVCYGDMPLLRRSTYENLIAAHLREGNVCTLLTGDCRWELPYGRILRGEDGTFLGVVEDRDCTPEQRAIRELNVGVYVFDCKKLFQALGQLKNNNAQKEYYLTDVPAILRAEGGRVGACCACHDEELIGVNTIEQLRMVEDTLRREKPKQTGAGGTR